MSRILATLLTFTTYGTWLRGDPRGWTENARPQPPDPALQLADRRRLKHAPYRIPDHQLLALGRAVGRALIDRLNLRILALAVHPTHLHLVIASTDEPIPRIVKCAKDSARHHLNPGRPIWTAGYDKRFCFTDAAVTARIRYVEKHNLQLNLPPRPYDFIVPPI